MWNIRLQREHMTNLVSMSADRAAELIRRSMRHEMMENQPQKVQLIIQSIGAQPGVERIRIFDKEGRIRISTHEIEVGQMVDKRAEQCFVCHRADRPLGKLEGTDRIRTFERGIGPRVLGIVAPIRNEPDCSSAACHAHPPEQQVLGVLDVQLSLGPVDERVAASEWQLGFGLLVTVLAVLALAGFLVWRMVLRPTRQLTMAMAGVGAGDLSHKVEVTSSDEIGEMAQSWNLMTSDLERARHELETWSLKLEQRVREKTEALESAHQKMLTAEKMASLGKLSAAVAHEINNPLAGINTYARLLKKKLPEDAENGQILDLIASEAARCGTVVRNLLLFSRTPGGKLSEEDVKVLVERCVMLIRHKSTLQQVEIVTEVDPELPRVACYGSQIEQVILALSMNAIEAMPGGGTLWIRARRVDEEMELVVKDTGSGISSEDLPYIFEPFYTTKEEGSDEGRGFGLGLSVVYGIVNRHGGRVDVLSNGGNGTTFTVRLPLRQPQPEEAEEEVSA